MHSSTNSALCFSLFKAVRFTVLPGAEGQLTEACNLAQSPGSFFQSGVLQHHPQSPAVLLIPDLQNNSLIRVALFVTGNLHLLSQYTHLHNLRPGADADSMGGAALSHLVHKHSRLVSSHDGELA